MDLREWLSNRQRELGQSDRTFARQLGLTGAAWGMFRRGELRTTLRLVRAARQAFPSDADIIAALALSTNDPESKCQVGAA